MLAASGVLLSLVLYGAPAFPATAHIIYGSYTTRANAELALQQASSRVPEPLVVKETASGGRTLYRVMGETSSNITAQRALLKTVKARFADAWLAIEETTSSVTDAPAPGAVATIPHKPPIAVAPTPAEVTSAAMPPTDQNDTLVTPGLARTARGVVPEDEPQPVRAVPVAEAPTGAGSQKVPARQNDNRAQSASINVAHHDNVDVRIDGALTEAIWSRLPAEGSLTVIDPDTLVAPAHTTTTRLFYTDEGLYVGITAEQPVDKLIARLSSRDQEVNRDGVTVYLDTSGAGLYGLYFGVNLGGTLSDGTLLPESQLSALWDGPWQGKSQATESGYTAEMFLPWSMMAMPDNTGTRQMGLAVARRVAYLDEEWSWPALPKSKAQFISGLQPLALESVTPQQQLALFPFAATSRNRMRGEGTQRAGVDVFWRPSSALQLTATLNPDFGSVESDDVVVNLTAFETFFPEKRLFFLEGNDVFITSSRSAVRGQPSSTGARSLSNTFFSPPTTLLNTRRIGGAPRAPLIPAGVSVPGVELSKPTELLGAVKATGQVGAMRYGVMTAAEDDVVFYGVRDTDGAEVRLRQQGRDFHTLRMLYENTGNGRRSIGMMSTQVAHPDGDATTHGIDLQMRNKSGQVATEVQLIKSDVGTQEGVGGFVDVTWVPRQGIFQRFSLDYFDDKLDITDFGFLQRNDSKKAQYLLSQRSSANKQFRQVANTLSLTHERNTTRNRHVRTSIYLSNTLTFNNRDQLATTAIIAPARWDDRLTKGAGSFRIKDGGIASLVYGTDTSRVLSAAAGMTLMTENLGDVTLMGQAGITYKPIDRVSFELDLMYRRPDGWLIHLADRTLATYEGIHWGPTLTADVFLTARQQLRFSLQWVGIKARAQALWQVPAGDGGLTLLTNDITSSVYDFNISRLTSQLRYRWEIAPLSDLFVVYTRGSNIPTMLSSDFGDMFQNAVNDPIIDLFVIKLRYRFGVN